MKLLTLLVGAFLFLVVAGCGGEKESASTTTTTASGKPKANGCVTVTAPEAEDRSAEQPTTKLDVTKAHDVTISTNCGDFTIRLDPKQSPNAAASFAALAESGFFDNTVFHRISPGFVI